MSAKGSLTISIDLELAWAGCDGPLTSAARQGLDRERHIVRRLLALFADYEIRTTWAVVGHLMADRCAWQD